MKTSDSPQKERILTANFLFLCSGSFSAFGTFHLLLATLPIYILSIGGREAETGLIVGIFAASSVLTRPFVGQASDLWGKKKLMLLSASVLLASVLLYNVAKDVPSLLAVRLLHGAGWGAFSTAASAMVADIIPLRRRGEAVGFYGIASNLAMSLWPAIGVVVLKAFDFPILFYSSALIALFCLLSALFLKEQQKPKADGVSPRFAFAPLRLFEASAIYTAAIQGILTLSYATVVTFLPLFAVQRGIGNPGLFFTFYAIAVILMRGFAGKLSDRYGRGAVLVPGILLASLSLVLLSFATSLPLFLTAAVLYGVAFASVHPVLTALTIDRARINNLGAAMGTFSSAFDLGIALGSFLWGFVAQSLGYAAIYQIAAGTALISLIVFFAGRRGAPLQRKP